MNTPPLLKDLFFSIKHRPLQTSIDDEFVKVPRYRVVSCADGVLGVKPTWLADAKPKPSALGRHLVFEHGQADELSQELYERTFGVKPVPLHWTGAAPTGEDGPIGAWAAVVYGHAGYSVADVLRSPALRENPDTSVLVADWERALWQGQDAFAQELAAFQPALAFTNGYDYADELMFYVLVTLPETTECEAILNWADVSAINRPHQPVLVLKTGRFRTTHIEHLHKLTGAELLAGAQLALPELAKSFRAELRRFAEHYYHLRRTKVDPAALVPVVLDLYDTNRNVSSIGLDSALRNRVKRRVHAARMFFHSQGTDLAALVRFLMYQDAFDPAAFDRRAAEDVLSQRDAYRNLRNRLSIRLVNDKRRLDLHLASQQRDYDGLAREL